MCIKDDKNIGNEQETLYPRDAEVFAEPRGGLVMEPSLFLVVQFSAAFKGFGAENQLCTVYKAGDPLRC